VRAPLSWLAELAALPEGLTGRQLGEALVRAGLEVETVEQAGADLSGPVVLGRVLSLEPEPQKNGKTINWCRVDVGSEHNGPEGDRGIVCGAHNFVAGDLVVVALPGSVLPGDFAIAARKTYGHVSDGMICSTRELGLGEDHAGILVLSDPGLEPGQDAAGALRLREDVLDIAVTPDRGYCLSIRGLAREAAQSLRVAFRDPVDRPIPAATSTGHPVRLESPACPVFAALSVTGIDPSRVSPRWLSRRIQLAGMRPISLAVDITNYVMLETGQPLHAYDAERLSGPIVVRQAAPGEKVRTLDDVVRVCDPADLLITDDTGPIGLAGVMGGATTELADTTTSVVIEAAQFAAMTIARTSRRHKLASEASRRFERGVDPAAGYAAAHRAAELLVELAGGTLQPAETVVGAVPPSPVQTVDTSLPGRILGVDLTPERVVELIIRIGADVVLDGSSLTITPPTWRPDLRDPYDYVEEVGRQIGFDTIEPVVPRAPVGRGLTRSQRARRVITSALAGAGGVEVLSFPFTSVVDLDRMGVGPGDRRRSLTKIINPLSETSPYLRTTVLPGLFAAVARNTSRSNDDLVLFETGAVFFAPSPPTTAPHPAVDRRPDEATLGRMDDALGAQPRHLAAVLTGHWSRPGWAGPAVEVTWRHAAGLVDLVGRTVGLDLVRRAGDLAPFHPGRCAEIMLPGSDVVIGAAGELHPQVCLGFGLPARTCALEIDLDVLIAGAPEDGDVAPISPYPVVKEDVALIVDEAVPAAVLEQALVDGAGELLESIELFDIYRGPQLGAGKKSLAFALRFRAADRTLTDADSARARDAAVQEAVSRVGAVLRSS